MQKFLKKVHFLKKFASENLHGFTGHQIFFVQKVAFDECMIEYKFKKNCSIRFKNWKSYSSKLSQLLPFIPHVPARPFQDFDWVLPSKHLGISQSIAVERDQGLLNVKKWIFSTVFPHFWTSRFQLDSELLKLWKISLVIIQMTMESICSWVWRTP